MATHSSPGRGTELVSVREVGAAQRVVSPDFGPLAQAIIRRGDSEHTRQAYAVDLRTYAEWLSERGLAWDAVSRDDLDEYRESLASRFARATTNRRLVVVRSLYREALQRGLLGLDPATGLRSIRGRDERDGGALTRTEARELLDSISSDAERPGRRLIGLRDRALVELLVRTGLRRSEATGLRLRDLGHSQGYAVATIHGKGAVTRTAKLPPDVRRRLDDWLAAAAEAGVTLEADDPVFVHVNKGGRSGDRLPLSGEAVRQIVESRIAAAKIPTEHVTPHGLRATFVTLALEGGAPLHLVQRAAGHAEPRTTERYWRRKESLDDAAVDYVRLGPEGTG